MKRLAEKVLKDNEVVKFTAFTEEYGVAEFVVCCKYVRGKLKCLYLYPAQQPDAKFSYRIDVGYEPTDWSISAWTHKGMENPIVWINFWCKEHNCPAFRVYVPRNATRFVVSKLSNLSVTFSV